MVSPVATATWGASGANVLVVPAGPGDVASSAAGGVGFEEPAGPGVGGQQLLDPLAQVVVGPADAVQVGGPLGRVGQFEGLAERWSSGRGSSLAWHSLRSRFTLQCSVRSRSAPRNPEWFHVHPSARASASQARANPQYRSAVRRGRPRALAASPRVMPAKNRSFTSSAAAG